MVLRHRAKVELWGRAPRTMSETSAPSATSHLERSASNEVAAMNCDAAGAHAVVSERASEAAPAAARGLR